MSNASVKFLPPSSNTWREPYPDISSITDPIEIKEKEAESESARDVLKEMLLSSLQMQNVSVLAGSGTSLTGTVNGPSMSDLWSEVKKIIVKDGSGGDVNIESVKSKVHYNPAAETDVNVEEFLSRCESYLQVVNEINVKDFVQSANKKLLDMCSFVNDKTDLSSHRTFLHRLSRRRVRDSRLKLFTTNYDLCFERAAGMNGFVVIDGFSFSYPRSYDPRFFGYDIVRRPRIGEDLGNYLEGVIQLYKLHGSVNWERGDNCDIYEKEKPAPEKACLIYPAKGKYQQSYIQPHLELMAQYLSTLREPNTCLLVIGFGFNDDHLSEPIYSAIKSNPHLRLIIANISAENNLSKLSECHKYWKWFKELAQSGEDIWFINASFYDLANLLPDLRSLTKAERLAKSVKAIAGGSV